MASNVSPSRELVPRFFAVFNFNVPAFYFQSFGEATTDHMSRNMNESLETAVNDWNAHGIVLGIIYGKIN